jgi:hypothetical protein
VITVSVSDNNGGSWTVLGTRSPASSTLTPMTSFDLSAYSGNQVRIKLETLAADDLGGAGVDDLTVNCQISAMVPDFVTGYENAAVGAGTSHTVQALNPDTQYYYRVRATSAGQTSPNSNVQSAHTTIETSVIMFK